ncbi:MAG: sigma-54-dependent Fis family transcriptional regulator [Pirellulaceae bacterium]|nr:sigma-54-dependent Fis family transcriptional regulator [Pirellulaceae bacterium]
MARDGSSWEASLVRWTAQSESADGEGLTKLLGTLVQAWGVAGLGVVTAQRGKWTVVAEVGVGGALPVDLLAEVLDQGKLVETPEALAAPLATTGKRDDLLLARGLVLETPARREEFLQLLELLQSARDAVRSRLRAMGRAERLEAVLAIAGQWHQIQRMDVLLEQMAEAATRLLGAERASIFLWDRGQQELIGRPALGAPDGELRIADDAGIVGQVVQTGETRRVDLDDDAVEIDRRVDQQLDFQTRTLLCCALTGSDGERLGAFEMINKCEGNFTDEDEVALLELAAQAALALEGTHEVDRLLKQRVMMTNEVADGIRLIGESAAIEALQSTVERVAGTDLAVLILGENGTGKEIISQMVHYLSPRRQEPLVAVNCAALTETLLESELFGHVAGAFTDARESRAGKFELASGGTLFLDEIGEMSLGGQAKLLRVLEEKVVVRVGGSSPIATDARVIAATNQNLAEMVQQKRFREDLYFRLTVVSLELPPLRDRDQDVLLLAEFFLETFSPQARRKVPRLMASARKRLLSHSWPGNVRELRNLMERVVYLVPEDKIEADQLDFVLSPDREGAALSLDLPLNDATREFQVQYIGQQIDRVQGNMTAAAQRLGLHRSNLYRKMRQLGMETGEA